jgi:HlyD family secretion protein
MMAAGWPVAGLVRPGREQAREREREPARPIDGLEWVFVQRADLETTLLAGGDLQPTKQATVTCQVEDVTDSDGMVILSVIENGARVKKGDELCRLDSSRIEELARREEIVVNQERSALVQAELAVETARIALREYEQGLVTQFTKEFEGRIALGRSDAQRQADRVAWAEAMEAKGYLSKSQLLTERQTLDRVRYELRKAEGELALFRRFQAPKEIKSLRGQIEMAEINRRVEADRLKAEEDRLAYLRKQIENCAIRAPQDGVVVYANGSRWRSRPIEPGTRVYEDQTLFVLPDPSRMEVEVSVHESVGPRVRLGMRANVRLASVADRVIPGRVVSIDQLSSPNWKIWDDDVRHFLVRVRLDSTPPSALPFMSASVEFDTGRVPDALVIPVEALAVVDGRPSCYVLADGRLQRRPITTRRATTNLLEVTGGLDEGERVVLHSIEVDKSWVDDLPEAPPDDLAREQTAPPSRSESSPPASPQAS